MRQHILSALVAAVLVAPALADDLLVTAFGTHSVLRYDGNTGAFKGTFIASGAGTLFFPHSVTVGPDNHVYVTSFANDRVLRYDGATGAFINRFVMPGSGGLDGPTSAEFGPDGHLYVTSFNTPAVLRYDGTSGAFLGTFIGAGNGLFAAEAGHFGPGGDYYLSNGDADTVLKYDGQTGAFLGVIAAGNGLRDSHYNITGPNGNLLVSAFENNRILEFDRNTGAFIREFVSPGFELVNPHGMKFGTDGFLYVVSFGRNRVLRYDGVTGAYDSTFVTAGSGGLSQPVDLAFLPGPRAKSYGCGVNPAGSLVLLSGAASAGATLTLGVENPLGTQAPGALPVLRLSLAPDPAFPCGTTIPNWGQSALGSPGELLIKVGPVVFMRAVGAPWTGTGNPAPFAVPIPPDAGLIGLPFYAQGALLDPTTPGLRIGLTEALELTIGH